jgi:hypothetical protein
VEEGWRMKNEEQQGGREVLESKANGY